MSINRRKFIQQTGLAGAALLAGNMMPAFAAEKERKITILHTNDVHSRLEPFPMDGSRNQGLGGVAPRAELIKQIRQQAENVLLLDAGDIFQGTPYFNIYKGEPEIKAMTMMEYDAATIGNHDFDAGLENLALQLKHASFPMVISNYDFSRTPMEGKTIPYKIIKRGDVKVGILGVGIELAGLVPDSLYGNTVYHDPIKSANETAAVLRDKEDCDMIICLSHLGDKYSDNKVSDEILAKETYNIDLIIGGHTHRFFDEPRRYKNKQNNDVVVNQVGWAGIQLGRLDFNFSGKRKKNLANAQTVIIGKKSSD